MECKDKQDRVSLTAVRWSVRFFHTMLHSCLLKELQWAAWMMIKNTLIVRITLRWAFGRFYSHIGNPNWAVRRKPKVLPRIESQQLLSNTSVKLDDCHIILLCLKGSKSYEFNQTILNWESDSVVNPEDFAASLCASCGPGNLFAQDISSEQNPSEV